MSRAPLKSQIAADLADARAYISQLEADNARLRAQNAAPSTPRGVRSSKLAALRAFATKFKCSARYNGDVIELYSKKRGVWVPVPQGAAA